MNALEFNFVALGHAILTNEPVDTILEKYELIEKLTTNKKKNVETNAMIELKEQGVSYREIAKKFGLKPNTVYYRIYRLANADAKKRECL